MDKKQKKVAEPEPEPEPKPKYEVYVRLPFNRNGFVDPPSVDWDQAKSDRLWSIVRDVDQTTENTLDWNQLATQFGVGVEFLIAMGRTLVERHRRRMEGLFRVTGSSVVPPQTTAGTPDPHAEVMRRTGSATGRPSSQLSFRRDTTIQAGPSGTPLQGSVSTARGPLPSRTLGQTTPGPSQRLSPRPKSPVVPRSRRLSGLQTSTVHGDEEQQQAPSPFSPNSPAKSVSSSSSSDSSSPVESRIIKRPPRFQQTSDGEDEDSEPAFLPYRAAAGSSAGSSGATTTQDLGATLRGDPRATKRPAPPGTSSVVSEEKTDQSQTSDSSTSYYSALKNRRTVATGPLSPRRTAELAGRSPRGRVAREGSDGTPSMGSSFSDLDDASVTQSALEEALASRMQDGTGTIGSRMSTFGQAIRSRYLPKGNNPQQGNPQP